jgi:hypothetical protein
MAKRMRKKGKAFSIEIFGPSKNPYTLILKHMKKEGIEEARDVMWEEAEYMASMVQVNILMQMLRFKPLSEWYARRKERLGLDPRILIATGAYVDSIGARWRAAKTKVYVGPPPEEKHPDSNITYTMLGAVHEFGSKSRNIPARPHWRPTLSQWKKRRRVATLEHMGERVAEKIGPKVKRGLKTKRWKV